MPVTPSIGYPATSAADARVERGDAKRIVMTTFGSLGDLHPYIAVALGLKARGHQPVIATSESYRAKVEALGIGFVPLRPDHPDWNAEPELMKRVMDLRTGSEFVVCEVLMPILHESYDDTAAAARGADLLVSHPLTFSTRIIAEQRSLPWASSLLSPLSFFSVYDPPVIPGAEYLKTFHFLGPALWRFAFWMAKWKCHAWTALYRRLRTELGLPQAPFDPLFEGQHSPHLTLAMFSKLLAEPQPDWPRSARVTGFAFYDRDDQGSGLSPELAQFLEEGAPPIVFTLGSSAVFDAGPFYAISAQVAKRLGRRAVLLVGQDERNRPASLPEGVAAFEYAPYSELFPRAAAIVHQGGAGTTGQAMRAGRPMLVMPYAHDQPDYAHRACKLGIARSVARTRYQVNRVTDELGRLLGNPAYARRAADVGQLVHQEEGVEAACDALEEILRSAPRSAQVS